MGRENGDESRGRERKGRDVVLRSPLDKSDEEKVKRHGAEVGKRC